MRAYPGYPNREVPRQVTPSAHVCSVSFGREADYGLGPGFALKWLFGSSLGLAAVGDAAALVKPGPAADDTPTAAVEALGVVGAASRVPSAGIPSLNGKPAQFFEL